MTPEDDPYWPTCNHGVKHFCQEVESVILAVLDGVVPGVPVCVPVLPTLDLYAKVTIGFEVAPDPEDDLESAELGVVIEGIFQDEIETIGLWSKGEGRMSIASVLLDWSSMNMRKPCNHHSHGPRQENRMNAGDESWLLASAWTMSMRQGCYGCYLASKTTSSSGAADYGLGDIGTSTRQISSTTPNASRARSLLQQRYGN